MDAVSVSSLGATQEWPSPIKIQFVSNSLNTLLALKNWNNSEWNSCNHCEERCLPRNKSSRWKFQHFKRLNFSCQNPSTVETFLVVNHLSFSGLICTLLFGLSSQKRVKILLRVWEGWYPAGCNIRAHRPAGGGIQVGLRWKGWSDQRSRRGKQKYRAERERERKLCKAIGTSKGGQRTQPLANRAGRNEEGKQTQPVSWSQGMHYFPATLPQPPLHKVRNTNIHDIQAEGILPSSPLLRKLTGSYITKAIPKQFPIVTASDVLPKRWTVYPQLGDKAVQGWNSKRQLLQTEWSMKNKTGVGLNSTWTTFQLYNLERFACFPHL